MPKPSQALIDAFSEEVEMISERLHDVLDRKCRVRETKLVALAEISAWIILDFENGDPARFLEVLNFSLKAFRKERPPWAE